MLKTRTPEETKRLLMAAPVVAGTNYITGRVVQKKSGSIQRWLADRGVHVSEDAIVWAQIGFSVVTGLIGRRIALGHW